jgi:hypothetical protein
MGAPTLKTAPLEVESARSVVIRKWRPREFVIAWGLLFAVGLVRVRP